MISGAALFAQVPAQGTIVKSKSNITNNIVADAEGRVRCVTPDGKSCSAGDMKEIELRLAGQAGVQRVVVEKDGALRCVTADGKGCSAAQVAAVTQAMMRGWDPQQSKAIVGRPAGKQ
jgi:predicted carbohydrate-binding protein with CBM5 and CBM33 domain